MADTKKKRSKKKEEKIEFTSIKSNPKIDAIVKDYPESLYTHPRAAFEDQLKKHLLKHNIK